MPVQKADVPAPLIPHSFCSAELLAHIIYEKYINAVPLYRQEKSFKNIGADISRTTMANWIIYTALEKAKPIYSAMKRELLKGRCHSCRRNTRAGASRGRKKSDLTIENVGILQPDGFG